MRVVICGGGVIGACTAYFLTRGGVEVTVVEQTGVACAASGRSGAFLARDWNAGTPLDALTRRSFELHARLPDEVDADWAFHGVTAYAGYVPAGQAAPGRGPITLDWLSDAVVVAGRLGTPEDTAVIHPALFTEAVLGAARRRGAQLRLGRVTGVLRDGSRATGAEVDGAPVPADAVVVAMGPWTARAAAWLPLPGVVPDRGHSLVFDTGTAVPPDALFLEYQEETGAVLTPEVFPRADGTTYVTAFSERAPLPTDPAEVTPDPVAISRLEALCARLSPAFDRNRILVRQACHRPVTQDGLPLIGRVPGVDGAYVATGHSVWGMLEAPATGEALAELIVAGHARSTDLTPFDPARLRPLGEVP
jgi:glycine/D-amino acid oxidase-like deaminating enzyme